MKELLAYLLETLACSGVLLVAYGILLDRRVRFPVCRAYLPLVLPGSLLAAVGIDWLLRRLRANRRLQTALGAVLVLGVFVAFRQGVVQQRNPDWRAWFRSAASLPPGMLTVFPANASQPVAWNSRPESYRDFFRRLSYRGEGERAVVLVGCRGLNGTDRYGGERVQLLPDDGREALQIGALEGYCYRLRELSGPVGIVDTMTDVGSQAKTAADAAQQLAFLAALIAVNLAVGNLLPLPALWTVFTATMALHGPTITGDIQSLSA